MAQTPTPLKLFYLHVPDLNSFGLGVDAAAAAGSSDAGCLLCCRSFSPEKEMKKWIKILKGGCKGIGDE